MAPGAAWSSSGKIEPPTADEPADSVDSSGGLGPLAAGFLWRQLPLQLPGPLFPMIAAAFDGPQSPLELPERGFGLLVLALPAIPTSFKERD